MIEFAVSMPPQPGPGMTFMQQCSVEHVVGGFSLQPVASLPGQYVDIYN
jgi:hypothetical protein